jgi:hypothetical protein
VPDFDWSTNSKRLTAFGPNSTESSMPAEIPSGDEETDYAGQEASETAEAFDAVKYWKHTPRCQGAPRHRRIERDRSAANRRMPQLPGG